MSEKIPVQIKKLREIDHINSISALSPSESEIVFLALAEKVEISININMEHTRYVYKINWGFFADEFHFQSTWFDTPPTMLSLSAPHLYTIMALTV